MPPPLAAVARAEIRARTPARRSPVDPAPAPQIDVELVEISPDTGAPPMIPPLHDLNRRDFFMFFVGIGSGLLAYGLGHFFASLLSRGGNDYRNRTTPVASPAAARRG